MMWVWETIEALLIARELLLRKKVKEIVVACPPRCFFSGETKWSNDSD